MATVSHFAAPRDGGEPRGSRGQEAGGSSQQASGRHEEQEEEDEEAFEVLADEQEAKEDARAEAINIANGY